MIALKHLIAFAGFFATFTLAGTGVGLSQDAGNPGYPYTSETKEERTERLEKAKARAKEYIARARAGLSNAPDAEQIAKDRAGLASDSAISDPSLQPGDIVSTTKGLFVFRGPLDRDRRPEDFVPLLEDIRRQSWRR
jgi:hypothetical protein